MDSHKKDVKDLKDLMEFSDVQKQMILNMICNSGILHRPIDIAEDVYKDTGIDKWAQELPELAGSKTLVKHIIRNPISDIGLLKQRQNTYTCNQIDFSTLKQFEDDALWVYKLNDEIKKNNLINVLFPSMFLVSYINYVSPLLELYHIAKIYLIPLNVIIYPILSILAPLYYLNRYMMFNISVKTYISILLKFLRFLFTFSGNIKATIIKLFTIVSYMLLFVYNLYQTVEYSYMLFKIKNMMYAKMCNLNIFLREAGTIISSVSPNIIKPFVNISYDSSDLMDLPDNFTSIYKIWKDQHIKDKISKVLVIIYTIDVINSFSNLKIQRNWCLTRYSDNTKIWNMKNPVLSSSQVANPVDLSRNIILTGPNAAGKTTYVKSILSNIILSQTFGLANAFRANTIIYNSIISFMRITDILGSKSYFEVEAEYCRIMMDKAYNISVNKKNALFLMDEPMHSTPPTEGMATAFAVAEYIGNLDGTNVILTTHFHKLTTLEDIYPDTFLNLSVDAIPLEEGFHFPYTVKKGHSYQCIAIELLSSKEFPESVIKSAIKMKNKIYSEINSK